MGLRAPARWKKYHTPCFRGNDGSDPKGNEACHTLPHFAVHCMLRRGLCRAQDPFPSDRLSRWLGGSSLSHFTQEQIVLRKDDVEIGNSGSNTTPEPKNDLKGLLP
jgi:hypothetical protein